MPNQFRRAIIAREFKRARFEALSSHSFATNYSHSWRARMRERLTRA